MKKAFLSSANALFDDSPNKSTIISRIQVMPISARTIERRITDIPKDVNKQQTIALKTAHVFSAALDESIDINDKPRLAVVAGYCCDGELHEELCSLKPMYGTTTGKNIIDIFIKHFEERRIDMKKIFSVPVTTNGAPAMIGQHPGFINLTEQKIMHPVMKLHCIVHQENLCAKTSKSALNDVTKIVNFLVARSTTTYRQFRSLLEEMESSYHDLPLHCVALPQSLVSVGGFFAFLLDTLKKEKKIDLYIRCNASIKTLLFSSFIFVLVVKVVVGVVSQ